MSRLCAICLLMLCAPAAGAHPHIFVDTALRLVTDEAGQITGVEVSWTYDELYSLLVLEDMELDDDYDGVLTEAELKTLHGFDMNWVAGFAGDLYASDGADDLALGPPQPRDTAFEDGKIVTRHYRALEAGPVPTITLRAYDPTFYTAYDLTGGVHAPEGCNVAIDRPDLDAAYAVVEEKLKDLPPDPDDYPAVGDLFADTVRVTCG